MTTEINGIFEQVRDRLKQLGNGIADLAQNHADILDSLNIQDSWLCRQKLKGVCSTI